MNARALALAALFVFTAGCQQLKAGRCNHNSDCDQRVDTCNLTYKVCERKSDAGAGGAGGGGGGGGGGAMTDAGADKPKPTCLSDLSICNDPAKPFCDTSGVCRGCKKDGECQSLDGGTSFCSEVDGGTGMCVQCLGSSDCQDPGASACVSNVCQPCAADVDCAKFAPGVCAQPAATGDAAPPPRRCASGAEIIYVNRAMPCSDTPTTDGGSTDGGVGGSPAVPFCSLQPALNAISKTRNVIVITGSVAAGTWTYADQAKGPLLMVGKSTATVIGTGAPSVSMSSGTVTIRNVDFQSVLSNGIEASGGTLTLDHVTVEKCVGGGILLDGASFNIQNSTIRSNGVATDGLVSWSGIYVKTVPATPSNLSLVTIHDNDNAGLQCAGKIMGTGVLAYRNMGGIDIGSLCIVTNCGSSDANASTVCGTQM